MKKAKGKCKYIPNSQYKKGQLDLWHKIADDLRKAVDKELYNKKTEYIICQRGNMQFELRNKIIEDAIKEGKQIAFVKGNDKKKSKTYKDGV